jgi:hypothetical protein
MIVGNYATNLIFFAQMAGRPAKARQAKDVPIAIGKSTSNTSVYNIVGCFLIFASVIADIHVEINPKLVPPRI